MEDNGPIILHSKWYGSGWSDDVGSQGFSRNCMDAPNAEYSDQDQKGFGTSLLQFSFLGSMNICGTPNKQISYA